MTTYFRDIGQGAYSLAVGMRITLSNMFRRKVTLRYPYEQAQLPARYRGHIELKLDQVTRRPKCVVCLACQKVCPSGCIHVDGRKPEGEKRKIPTTYVLEFSLCSLCGLCVESCRFDALQFSKQYNLAYTRRADCTFDLLGQAQGRE
jgi:NADH-quinone oxidoreductase subunit I